MLQNDHKINFKLLSSIDNIKVSLGNLRKDGFIVSLKINNVVYIYIYI